MSDRRLKIVLAISILLNLFALGAGVGAVLMWSRVTAKPAASVVHRRPIRRAGDALPPAEREQFRRVIRATARDARPIRLKAQESRRDAASLFIQPRFDAAAVNAALTGARSADFALRSRLETAVVEFASRLPVQDRTALARSLGQGGPLRQPKRANLP